MVAPIQSGGITRPLASATGTRPQATPATPSSHEITQRLALQRGLRFPDELLLGRDPQRFNTQLNQQITAVQRATDYLGETEINLRGLLLPANSNKRQAQLRRARQLINEREKRSGLALDRNFQPCLDRPAQVIFHCSAIQALLVSEQREIITFSLGEGTFRHWGSLLITPEMSVMQRVFALNRTLGQFQILSHYDQAQQRLLLSIPEIQWPALSQWAARGSGHCFAADSLTWLQPQPLLCFTDHLLQLLSSPGSVKGITAEQALHHLQNQRHQLGQQRQKVSQHLQGVTTHLNALQARQLAVGLRQQLAGYRSEFRGLNQALQAQANLPLAVICQLLADT